MRLPIGYLALLLPASLVALVAAAGCEDTTDTTNTIVTDAITTPTVEIDPADFLWSCPPGAGLDCPGVLIRCADLPGAMQSYVVTFIDTGPPVEQTSLETRTYAPGFPVDMPASPPTSCSQRVAFTRGVVGHEYEAVVDGYEQSADEIVPACSVLPAYTRCAGGAVAPTGNGVCTQDSDCFANGCYGRCEQRIKEKLGLVNGTELCVADTSVPAGTDHRVCVYQTSLGGRRMVSRDAYQPVSPRWTTREDYPCGFTSPADPRDYEKVGLADCAPLVDHGGTTATSIKVDTAPLLGSLECRRITQVKNPNYVPPVAIPDGGLPEGGVAVGQPEYILAPVGTVFTIDVADVTPAGSTLSPKAALECGASTVFESGVVAGRQYFFEVRAYEVQKTSPSHSATCVAIAEEGVTTVAKCVPLAPVNP